MFTFLKSEEFCRSSSRLRSASILPPPLQGAGARALSNAPPPRRAAPPPGACAVAPRAVSPAVRVAAFARSLPQRSEEAWREEPGDERSLPKGTARMVPAVRHARRLPPVPRLVRRRVEGTSRPAASRPAASRRTRRRAWRRLALCLLVYPSTEALNVHARPAPRLFARTPRPTLLPLALLSRSAPALPLPPSLVPPPPPPSGRPPLAPYAAPPSSG